MDSMLVCPIDRHALSRSGDKLRCDAGHEYATVCGIPVLLRPDVPITHEAIRRSLAAAQSGEVPRYWSQQATDNGIDPLVQRIVAATNGNLYRHSIGKLRDYPIPAIRLPAGNGETLLDVGCNWGRWSIAAARKGYRVVGIDPDLEALVAASRIAKTKGVEICFVCADARYLPFQSFSFSRVFSYSVIQHFSKPDARAALSEIARVLKPGGESLIQMPNALGIRSLYHQVRRGFRARNIFDVRYWTPRELSKTFKDIIGPTDTSVDGFFGLGIQASDLPILPLPYRLVVRASEGLRRLARDIPPLMQVADSLYLHSRQSRQELSQVQL
jgi:2-polyprenyl-3-methyl-5-hydroxy-6-metoxy-1,4-benzoquinol methylase/uncharacterized protein YbaR (Trm112 family)